LYCPLACYTKDASESGRHVIGLDVGTTTGWCYMHVSRDGTLRSSSGQLKFSGTEGEKLTAFDEWLFQARGWNGSVDLAVFEDIAFNRGRSGFLLNGLTAVLMVAAERFKIPYVGVHTSKLKKYAVKGDASKEEMVAAALRSSGREMSKDEADAYWLARFGATEVLPEMEV
jgi:hypothetical protein